MKKLLLVTSMFLCFAGVVSASSVNGDYKGNPIVKLKSNGSLVDTGDVPAMIYDGKTMVPIAALRNLGANVTWDQNTYSVDVKISNSGSSSNQDVEKLKLYSKISDKYRALMAIGNINYNLYTNLYYKMNLNRNYDSEVEQVSVVIDMFNKELKNVEELSDEAKAYNVNIGDMNGILANYSKAIDEFKLALNGTEDVNRHLDGAFDISNAGLRSATSKYFEYYDMVQNF